MSLSGIQLSVSLGTVARQTPLSKGSPAKILEWVAIPVSGDLPNQGLKQGVLRCRRILAA